MINTKCFRCKCYYCKAKNNCIRKKWCEIKECNNGLKKCIEPDKFKISILYIIEKIITGVKRYD